MTSFENKLAELLKQDPATMIDRQKFFFREATSGMDARYVLFGAGRLGRITLAGLRKAGVEPLAFMDNNPKLWNTMIEGLQVLSPQSGAEKFGSKAIFVITVYTSAPVWKQLNGMGLKVISFATLAWQYPESLTPHGGVVLPSKIFEQANEVRKALNLWSDETSRREYMSQLLWQSLLDPSVLPPHLPQQDIYFDNNLYTSLEEEVFVDCGAFDGDSIKEFLTRRNNSFGKIIAIEPDPENCKVLEARVAALPTELGRKIKIFQNAAGSRREIVTFNVTGTAGSSIGSGDYKVSSIPLDELNDFNPTLIKMDIEGAEPDAILGASNIIRKNMPILAICTYHAQEHLWQVPLLIQSISNNYKFFLKRYSDECWETVCYAVPQNRLIIN